MVEYRQNPNGLKLSMVHKKPLNVGLVARICRVSKKTVLNWIYKDALKAFTTFGGHYRIWPGDLKKFMTMAGLDVPFQFVDERQTAFLIVDDDEAYTMLLKEAICTNFPSADVITTDDGFEALLLIGERKPNVILLDLRMPKLDGFQVLELLRPRKKDGGMKVVVLSAFVDDEVRQKLQNTVADEVWEKKRDIFDLIASLRVMLETNQGSKTSPRPQHPRNGVRQRMPHAV